jgi:hypothetical protein
VTRHASVNKCIPRLSLSLKEGIGALTHFVSAETPMAHGTSCTTLAVTDVPSSLHLCEASEPASDLNVVEHLKSIYFTLLFFLTTDITKNIRAKVDFLVHHIVLYA